MAGDTNDVSMRTTKIAYQHRETHINERDREGERKKKRLQNFVIQFIKVDSLFISHLKIRRLAGENRNIKKTATSSLICQISIQYLFFVSVCGIVLCLTVEIKSTKRFFILDKITKIALNSNI